MAITGRLGKMPAQLAVCWLTVHVHPYMLYVRHDAYVVLCPLPRRLSGPR